MPRKEPGSTFGSWLRGQLDARGMSQSDLAAAIGANTGLLTKWILGRSRPSPESAARIAAALGMDAAAVLAAREPVAREPVKPRGRRRVIALVGRVNLTPDREAQLAAMLEAWLADDERGQDGASISGACDHPAP